MRRSLPVEFIRDIEVSTLGCGRVSTLEFAEVDKIGGLRNQISRRRSSCAGGRTILTNRGRRYAAKRSWPAKGVAEIAGRDFDLRAEGNAELRVYVT